jgi:ankyrin repeat protein
VFLEMWTVLNGATAQDLRKLMLAHSGRLRYYENLDVVVDWTARLSGDKLESEEEVMDWIKGMLVIEPSARTKAQELFSLISTFGKEGRNKATENKFCGDCCAQEHDEDASSESVSDDDVWGGDFGDDITTPATSPPATDPTLRPRESSSMPHAPRQATLPVLVVSASFESLAVSEAESDKDINDDGEDDAKLLETSQASNPRAPESVHLKTVTLGGTSNCDAQEEMTTQQAVPPRTSEDPTAAVTELATNFKMLIGDEASTSTTKDESVLDRKVKVRQEAVRATTSNHSTWPFTDLQGRLPNITAEDWEKPSVFLNAVRSDVAFMEYLKLIDADQFERVQVAAPEGLFPIMHLLLLNGLNVNNSKSRSTDGPRKGAMPLYRTLRDHWTESPGSTDIAKLLIGFGATVGCVTAGNFSALGVACTEGDIELVQYILDLDNSTLNGRNSDGRTPVYFAARAGHHMLVDLLIKRGANFRTETGFVTTPATIAATRGHLEVLKVLMAHGLRPNEGTTSVSGLLVLGHERPLTEAAKSGQTEVVEYLLSKGADPTWRSGTFSKLLPSSNAYGIAKKAGHQETARMLEQAIREWKRKG